jgi:hypothetical protein
MFCRNCGKEVLENAVVCSGCGHSIGEGDAGAAAGNPWNLPLFIAFIFAALSGIPGIVLGAMGLGDPGKKVQAAVLLTIGILMTLFWGAALWGV